MSLVGGVDLHSGVCSDLNGVLVVTEGFGIAAMSDRTFEVLSGFAGCKASVSGITQVRAGVIRPEVLVPAAGGMGPAGQDAGSEELDLFVGCRVRAVAGPRAGMPGTIADLPREPMEIATEALVRAAVVEFDGGERAVVPRANLELIV